MDRTNQIKQVLIELSGSGLSARQRVGRRAASKCGRRAAAFPSLQIDPPP